MSILRNAIRSTIERFPALATTLRTIRDQRKLLREPANTHYGFRFSGNASMEKGIFEPEETEVVTRLLKETDTFVNVGANIGYYVCHALRAKVETIAFEPIPSNLQLLYNNVFHNSWENKVEIFPVALGENAGVTSIYGGGTAASLVKGYSNISEHYVTRIPVNTLDAVLGRRCHGKQCLFLVDVEGYEYPLLQSATENLSRQPSPWWVIEINVTDHQTAGSQVNPKLMPTFERMWDLGYLSWTATTHPSPVFKEHIQSIIRDKHNHLDVHNFLFAKPDNLPVYLSEFTEKSENL